MPFATSGELGVNLAAKSTTQQFALGTQVFGSDGRIWMYVKAGGTIAADADTAVDGSTFAATSASGIFTTRVSGGVVANDYFWAQKDLT